MYVSNREQLAHFANKNNLMLSDLVGGAKTCSSTEFGTFRVPDVKPWSSRFTTHVGPVAVSPAIQRRTRPFQRAPWIAFDSTKASEPTAVSATTKNISSFSTPCPVSNNSTSSASTPRASDGRAFAHAGSNEFERRQEFRSAIKTEQQKNISYVKAQW